MFKKLPIWLGQLFSQYPFRNRLTIFLYIYFFALILPLYWFLNGQNVYIVNAEMQIQNYKRQFYWSNLFNDSLKYFLSTSSQEEEAKTQEAFDLSMIKAEENFVKPSEIKNLISLWTLLSEEEVRNKNYQEEMEFVEMILKEVDLSDSSFGIRYRQLFDMWNERMKNERPIEDDGQVRRLLSFNKYLTNAVLNHGLEVSQRNLRMHIFIRNTCVAVIFLGILITLFYAYYHLLSTHFAALNHHVKALSQGKFKKCFCSDSRDEFRPVGIAFDRMSLTMQQIIKELQQLGRKLTQSIKQITQTSKEQNHIIINNEQKVHELEEYTKSIVNRSQMLTLTMNELYMNSKQSDLTASAEETMKKMHLILDSLTTRAALILQHLSLFKNKMEQNEKLSVFMANVSTQAFLLALNSSIAASTISDDKQSFLKITEEIKRFAQKTALSTQDIKNLFKGISQNIQQVYVNTENFIFEVKKSIETLHLFEKHLTLLFSFIIKQSGQFEEVSKIMQDQTLKAVEIKKNLDGMVQIADKNTQLTKHLDHSMDELQVTVEKLQTILNQFFHPKKSDRSLIEHE